MQITFERLVSRGAVRFLSRELDLAGMKMGVNTLLELIILGGFASLIVVSFILLLYLKMNAGIAAIFGIGAAIAFAFAIYAILEFLIDKRKTFVESIFPDYIQLTAANLRSGIALDKAMLMAARPEFGSFSEEVKLMNKQLYAGETMQNALALLASRYRSLQLQHTMRMINESIQYGGGMTDLLNQIAKDLRNQNTIQKEISGQLFMYTIFIAFAALIGAPALYALTSRMITVTYSVFQGIFAANPNGLPSLGLSFFTLNKPKIDPQQYQQFALIAIFLISGLASFIVSTISSGSIVKGIRYLPVFIVIGYGVFWLTSLIIGAYFNTISFGGGP
jgi:pilus assembly protein TadC